MIIQPKLCQKSAVKLWLQTASVWPLIFPHFTCEDIKLLSLFISCFQSYGLHCSSCPSSLFCSFLPRPLLGYHLFVPPFLVSSFSPLFPPSSFCPFRSACNLAHPLTTCRQTVVVGRF